MAVSSFSRGYWTLAILGTLCILAALLTQVATLTWRNWVQMTIPWHNATSQLQMGLWGSCVEYRHNVPFQCYAFHSEGQNLPWHLQVAVFLSMVSICMDVLILALCFLELIYIWQRKEKFPLKKAQLYLALCEVFFVITIIAVMGFLVISGYEQRVWDTLRDKMNLSGPEHLGSDSKFSLSQAWGFQVLSCVYFICYMIIAKIQMAHAVVRLEVTVGAANGPSGRRVRIDIISPSCPNGVRSRTPPPAYSPPPAYGLAGEQGEEETCFNGDGDTEQQADSNQHNSSSLTLLL